MPPSHIERPSPATSAPAACLPAPAAAGQGVGTIQLITFGFALTSLLLSLASLTFNVISRCDHAPVFQSDCENGLHFGAIQSCEFLGGRSV